MKQIIPLLLCSLFLVQCNTTTVSGGLPAGTKISKLAIVNNNDIHMAGLQPEMVRQIREMGIATEVVDAPPSGNDYYLTYTANWSWDLAMYLRYFKANLHQGPVQIGSVEYNTSGADMNKFGHTDAKIRPLLRQLLLGEAPAKRQRKHTPAPNAR